MLLMLMLLIMMMMMMLVMLLLPLCCCLCRCCWSCCLPMMLGWSTNTCWSFRCCCIFFAVVSAYTDANVACADANVVPDAFVDGGYANVDDALNW